jgi:hypothetical protein
VETDLTDQAGVTTRTQADTLRQRYGLSLDRTLTEYLGASIGGTLVDDRGWRRTNGTWSDVHSRSTTLFGRLNLGTPVLNAGLGVDRREQQSLLPARPTLIAESFTVDASWRPIDLPEIQLRFSHVNTFDTARRERDVTTDAAQLATRYHAPRYDIRFLLGWNRAIDRLNESETTSIEETVLVTRNDQLLDGRMATYLSGTVQSRSNSTSARGPGATVLRRQLPVEGLSAVLTAPLTSADVRLSTNSPLVDGSTTAGAAVNLGFGLAALGDTDAREVGARFADLVTEVNTIHVWLVAGAADRPLTPEVAAALAASVQVHQSADNQRWSAVALDGVPSSTEVENRLDIRIARTAARYLKVTLRPLAPTVTTDAAFRDLFVSEVQFVLELRVEEVPRSDTDVLLSATGIARTKILREPELAHDITATVTRRTERSLTSYTIVNGLSFRHELARSIAANARAARQDLDEGAGHEGSWQWSAALVGNPLPTAFWTLSYSGTANDRDEKSHSVTALGRADLYEGISAQATAGGSFTTQGLRVGRSFQTSGTMSLTPNPYVTLSGGGLYSRSLVSDPLIGDTLAQFGRVDGSVSLTPAPAVSATGTVSRVLLGARPTTLATMQLNYFPLRGEVHLAVAYSKTLDTEADATTELLSPSLRWNIRSGVSLNASYTVLENASPTQTLDSRAFAARLLIIL